MNEELFAELVVKIKAGNNCRMQFTSIEDAFNALPNVLTQFILTVAKAVCSLEGLRCFSR